MLQHLQLHLHLLTSKDGLNGHHFSHAFLIRKAGGKVMRIQLSPLLHLGIWNVSAKSKWTVRARLDLWEKEWKKRQREGEASTGSLSQFSENSWHTFPSRGLGCQFNHFAYFGSHLIKMLVALEQPYFPIDTGFSVHTPSSNCDPSSLPSS